MLVDFHTHTNASDGELKPEELIDRALLLGLKELAITDHDTLNGWRSVRHHCDELGHNLKLRNWKRQQEFPGKGIFITISLKQFCSSACWYT